MSSSLYRDHNQNSASAIGNGLSDAPTKTLSHYGAGFTPLSEYDATPGSDAWPSTHVGTWQGPDDTTQPGLAGLPPNQDDF